MLLEKISQWIDNNRPYHDPMTGLSDFYAENPSATTRRKSRNRIMFSAFIFSLIYIILGYRALEMMIFDAYNTQSKGGYNLIGHMRGEITDRNGTVMATQLKVANLVADPSKIINLEEALDNIHEIFPDLNPQKLSKLLSSSKKRYVLIKRDITPHEQQLIHDLGIPALIFEPTERRIYPQNNLASHVIGLTDIDKKGIAGIEKNFDSLLRGEKDSAENIQLTIDLRVQNIIRNALEEVIEKFDAIGAAGVVMHAKTGEVLGMVSLPDFNPNDNKGRDIGAMFNRATVGAYEMGSTFKIFNTAIGIDTGAVKIGDMFNVSNPIYMGRHRIGDFHRINGSLSVADILKKSSNIGSVHIAEKFGPHIQQYYMNKFGMLKRSHIEIPEKSAPIIPKIWGRIQMMTISFGHGLAVTPLQIVSGVASVVNGGTYVEPTLIPRIERHLPHEKEGRNQEALQKIQNLRALWMQGDVKNYFKEAKTMLPNNTQPVHGERILSEEASLMTRYAMRLVCEPGGTGTKADVIGYPVIGKTGTAEKISTTGGYNHKSIISSFIGAFPAQNPEYVVYVMVDEPKPNKKISPYATGGVVGAPAVGDIVRQIAPILDVKPTAPDKDPAHVSSMVYKVGH